MVTKKSTKKSEKSLQEHDSKKDTRWKKGQSGNPKGREKGSKNKVTVIAQNILDNEAEDIIRQCIAMALSGDSTAMKLVVDRILPPRKDRPVSLSLPQMTKAEDAIRAMANISDAVANGDITPSEGEIISKVIEVYRKNIETVELENRLKKLEEKISDKKLG